MQGPWNQPGVRVCHGLQPERPEERAARGGGRVPGTLDPLTPRLALGEGALGFDDPHLCLNPLRAGPARALS